MLYFDNAASTKPIESVTDLFVKTQTDFFANPASQSCLGLAADRVIKQAQGSLASLVHAAPNEIYFTSGGTEGDNWAVLGTARGYCRTGRHIITTKTEHAAVKKTVEYLAEEGFEISYAPVSTEGIVDLDALSEMIRPDTILVSIILANNETGVLQNAEDIGALIKNKNPKTLFHSDAVQAFGKQSIDVAKMKLDLLTTSGHKFHGIKGTGFLYKKNGLKVKPLLYGGGQQQGERPGTEHPAACASLALAATQSHLHLKDNSLHVLEVKKTLVNTILESIEDTALNGTGIETDSPYVANISFLGVRSEVLLHALEQRDIFVSAGSACDSRKKHLSPVLSAMGLSAQRIEGSIRFSFSRFNTVEEAKECAKALQEIVPQLRRVHNKRSIRK